MDLKINDYLSLQTWQNTLNWQPNAVELSQFQTLYEQILAKNSQLNLTRITEPQEFIEKHIWDAIAPVAFLGLLDQIGEDKTAIDIGTGGGFPGVPLAIILPHYHLTLLDSVRKKITFLEELVIALKLNNIKPLAGRAEEIGQNSQHRETYDFVFLRALVRASVCAEYALPLLKMGGIALLYRGRQEEEETEKLQAIAAKLGGEIQGISTYQTPLTASDRHCIFLQKITPTSPQYPRRIGIPQKKPLE